MKKRVIRAVVSAILALSLLVPMLATTSPVVAQGVPSTPTNPRPGSTSAPGPVLSSKTVTLQWDASSGATRYALGVRNRNTGVLEVNTWVYGTSHTVTLNQNVPYQWNVAAWNDAGYSPFTSLRYFQTPSDVSTPSTPTNPRPGSTTAPGPVLSSKTVTLQWDASSGATRYALGVRNRNTGVLEVNTWVYGTSSTVTLNPNTPYQWNVAAWNDAGYSPFTALRYFQTPSDVSTPSTPTNPRPGSTSAPGPVLGSRTVTLEWDASSGATRYALGVRNRNTNVLEVDTWVYGTSHTVTLQANTPYQWNVAAWNDAGYSPFTSLRYFQTPNGVVKPSTPTNPRPGSTTAPGPVLGSKTVTLEWDASSGATRYALGVRNRNTNVLEVDTWVYGTSHTVTLNQNTPYQWNVAGWNDAGYSPFTTLRYFQTPLDTTKPVITSLSVTPLTATLGNPFTISFSASDSSGSGLKQVELWRASDSGGSPGTWVQIKSRAVSGSSYSGSFSDTPPSVGSYWYGIHAVDNANNWGAEPTPVKVTVTTSEPGIIINSYSPSTKITVEAGISFQLKVWFTNTADAGYFYPAVSIWDSAPGTPGRKEVLGSYGTRTYLAKNAQTSYTWTTSLREAGEYWLQFGVWNDAKSQLLAVAPSFSQNLIAVTEPAPRYRLTGWVNPPGGGTISRRPMPDADWKYAEGTVVTLTAIPAWGFDFSHWSGTDNNKANPTTVTMNSDKGPIAYFTTDRPILTTLDPESATPGTDVRLSGRGFGDQYDERRDYVSFGATRSNTIINWFSPEMIAYHSRPGLWSLLQPWDPPYRYAIEITSWADNEIVAEAPDDYGLGLDEAKTLFKALTLAASLGEATMFTPAFVLLESLIPTLVDIRPQLDLDENNQFKPTWSNYAKVVLAIGAEKIPGLSISPQGDISVPVRVTTNAGRSNHVVFTFEQQGPLVHISPEAKQALKGSLVVLLVQSGLLPVPPELVEQIQLLILNSPGELRVYDSQGRVTGLVEGELKQEIPSTYSWGNIVLLLDAGDHYAYEIAGTADGLYGMDIIAVRQGEANTLSVVETMIREESVHTYIVDWEELDKSQATITVMKDYEGDGEVDETIITGIPRTPTGPSPAHNSTWVALNTTLSWTGDELASVTYNVYFGTDTDFSLVSERQTETIWVPALEFGTTYYWGVVAIDEYGISGSSPLWSFNTTGYRLTASSSGRGSVIIPGEGSFGYEEGETVNLVAEPDEGYWFVRWTGDVDAVGDVNAAETTITMDDHYSVTANFLPEGTEPIWDWYDLDAIRDNLSGSYLLMNDLDSTTPGYEELASVTANDGKGWQPIGSVVVDPWTYDCTAVYPFAGAFDGQGHKIRGLYINRPTEDGVGLFGAIAESAVIQGVRVVNAHVTGSWYIGGLAGANWGTMVDSHSSSIIFGDRRCGGLVGGNLGFVRGSYSSSTVSNGDEVGGLVGWNMGSVTNSHSTGGVTEVGKYAGGLVGWNEGIVSYSGAVGDVSGYHLVGGLVGGNLGYVADSYSTGSVSGDESVGGLVGFNWGTVSHSYSASDVVADYLVGGLVGYNTGTIVDCYSTGSADGYHQIGGLLGFNDGIVSSSYSTASVSGTQNVGGLAGGNDVDGYVIDSHAAGNVSGKIWVGGLMGANGRGTIMACHSAGTVQGDSVVGGLVGVNYGSVSNSYSAGNVTGIAEVGGLAGRNGSGVDWGDDLFSGSVSNSYSTSSVIGHERAGGLVGYNYLGTITNSYSAGSVTGEQDVGGLVGWNDDAVSNSFWDVETSGLVDSAGGTGKTTAEMKSIATFMDTTAVTSEPVCPTISPTTRQYNLASPSNQTTTITWNSATSITSITDGSITLVLNTHYAVAGNMLTILTAYLGSQLTAAAQSVTLTINFDVCAPLTLTITAIDTSQPECISISPSTGQYNLGGPRDVTTTITDWGTVSTITSIHDGTGFLTPTTHYTVVGNTVTIKQAYLAGKLTAPGQSVVLTLNCDPICAALFIITAAEGLAEPWDIIAVAPGETNPAYTWNIVDGETYPFLSGAAGEPGPVDSPWPMFGQNPQRTGRSFYVGPETPELRWHFTTGDWVMSSPAIGVDGTVYVGSDDNRLYAIDADGIEKWSFTTGAAVRSSPAIATDGTIYVGSGDGNLYAINPDGSLKWSFTGGGYYSSPTIATDGTVYVGSGDGNLYAINPADGTEKWSFTTASSIASSPAIGTDGTIYVGSGGGNLYAIYPADGTEKWSFTTEGNVHSTPTVGSDGTIYVGSFEQNLYALNADGSEKWSFATWASVHSSAAIAADGTVYVGSGGEFYAINPDGTEKWSLAIGQGSFAGHSPAIGADGTIYVGDPGGNLYAINPDGTEKWAFAAGGVLSPAIGANGVIYAGSFDGKLYAIGEGSQEVIFPDPNLEAAIREAIGKLTGPIYASDLEGLTSLDAGHRNITDVTGLEYCAGLIVLYLQSNQISNTAPLSSLTNLTELNLSDNRISDISALVENEGLTEGDEVDLRENPLSRDSINVYIPQLEARGVIVYYDKTEHVIVITFDDVDIDECGDSWTKGGVELSIVETTEEDCVPGYCSFLIENSEIGLCPARLNLNLGALSGHIVQIETDIIDWGGGTSAFLYEGDSIVDMDVCDTPGSPETLIVVNNGSSSVDRFAVSSCEGTVTEIRILIRYYDIPRTWYVDDDLVDYPDADFTTIQEAVDAARPVDTIIVYPGLYIENVNVNKHHLTIQSQSGAEATIVQAVDPQVSVFAVTGDYVSINGFSVEGSLSSGIFLCEVRQCEISLNTIIAMGNCIGITRSSDNTISDNVLRGKTGSNTNGIVLFDCSTGNAVFQNVIEGNYNGILLELTPSSQPSEHNHIYLNNFMNNRYNFWGISSNNTWNSPGKVAYAYGGSTHTSYLGNYWSDYTGVDADGDGIGDTPYPIDSDADNYPLVLPFENYEIGAGPTPPIANLSLYKSDGWGQGWLHFDLTVSNDGPAAAEDVIVVDTLPWDLHFDYASDKGDWSEEDRTVTWYLGTVEPGTSRYLYLDVLCDFWAFGENRAVVSTTTAESNYDDNEAVGFYWSWPEHHFEFWVSGPSGVAQGSEITYALSYQNLCWDWYAENVQILYTLPPEVTFVSASDGGTYADGMVTWDLGTGWLDYGEVTVTVRVADDVPIGSEIVNTACISSTNEFDWPIDNYTYGECHTTVLKGANLILSKSGPTAREQGSTMTYTIYYQNFGTEPAENVVITDVLPPEVAYVSSSEGGDCPAIPGNVVTWHIGTVAGLGHGHVTVTVQIGDLVPVGTIVTNEATIHSANPETRYDDNRAVAATTIVSPTLPPNVGVEPNSGGTPAVSVNYNDLITFTFDSCSEAAGVDIVIRINDGGTDIIGTMTEGPAQHWTYTTTFFPRYGDTAVTYTVYGCPGGTEEIDFSIYVDPAGYVYDIVTGLRVKGAYVWLQRPDGSGGWENVPTGASPANMQPDVNPLVTGADGQYQWDVLEGYYRVHVEAAGYYSSSSIVVSIPPPVTDLHVGLIPLNRPPVADAGPDQEVLAIPPAMNAMVTLDGSASHDPDGDPLTYTWTWDDNTAFGVNPTVELALGTTTITLVVNDAKVDSGPDAVDITVLAPARLGFDPDVLNLRARGGVVTVYIELPEGFDVGQIDVSSIRLNDTVSALEWPYEVGDYNDNGIPDLMVKFDRRAVHEVVDVGEAVEITITGEVDGIPFMGVDTIRVIG